MSGSHKQLLIAIGATLLAALSYALMAACVKEEIKQDISAQMIVFWRSVVGLLFLLPMMHLFEKEVSFGEKIKTKRLGLHLIRSVSGFLGVIIFCIVLKDLSITVATLLFFTVPLFIPFVAFFWKKEPLPRLGWIGLISVLSALSLSSNRDTKPFSWQLYGDFFRVCAQQLGNSALIF